MNALSELLDKADRDPDGRAYVVRLYLNGGGHVEGSVTASRYSDSIELHEAHEYIPRGATTDGQPAKDSHSVFGTVINLLHVWKAEVIFFD